jgi:hypothetical protein
MSNTNVISSVDFLKHIVNFSICEFSKLFSDVHSPISLSLKCENKDEIMVTENVSNTAEFLQVSLPIPLSFPILPFMINKSLPLHKSNNLLP